MMPVANELEFGSPLPIGKGLARPRTVSFDPCSSPVPTRNKFDSIDFQTPQKKSTRKFSDDISTAAPSPWAGDGASPWAGDMESPWCSPSQLGGARASFHFPKGGFSEGPEFQPFEDMGPETPRSPVSHIDFQLCVMHPDEANSTLPLSGEAAVAAEASLKAPTLVEMTPPSTPRVAAKENMSPPSTPRQLCCRSAVETPPPKPQQMARPVPRLMLALHGNDLEEVREALRQDADAATLPFWDHALEPPMCFAVRQKCNAKIVSLLLQHGADPEMTNIHGWSAVDILTSMGSKHHSATYADITIVKQLLGVGPDPSLEKTNIPFPNAFGEDSSPRSWLLADELPPWAQPHQPKLTRAPGYNSAVIDSLKFMLAMSPPVRVQ